VDDTRKSSACDSDYACAYQYNISWSSPTTTRHGGRPTHDWLLNGSSLRDAGGAFGKQQTPSAGAKVGVDFVMEDTHSMQRRLGAGDKAKLDQYLTGVREIEARIQKAEKFEPSKTRPSNPGRHPFRSDGVFGIMFDLMVLAFQTWQIKLVISKKVEQDIRGR